MNTSLYYVLIISFVIVLLKYFAHRSFLTHCLNMYIFLFVSVEREDQRRPVMGFEFGHTVRLQRRPKAAKEYTSNGMSVLV